MNFIYTCYLCLEMFPTVEYVTACTFCRSTFIEVATDLRPSNPNEPPDELRIEDRDFVMREIQLVSGDYAANQSVFDSILDDLYQQNREESLGLNPLQFTSTAYLSFRLTNSEWMRDWNMSSVKRNTNCEKEQFIFHVLTWSTKIVCNSGLEPIHAALFVGLQFKGRRTLKLESTM